MLTFYAEMRRQEALERIALKEPGSESIAQLPPYVISQPLPAVSHKKRSRRTSSSPAPKEPRQKSGGGLKKICEICKQEYHIRPSHVNRYRTCAEPECRKQLRAISLHKHPLWTNPKKCEYPDCPNMLEPNRHKSKQEKYCSRSCAMRNRYRRS